MTYVPSISTIFFFKKSKFLNVKIVIFLIQNHGYLDVFFETLHYNKQFYLNFMSLYESKNIF